MIKTLSGQLILLQKYRVIVIVIDASYILITPNITFTPPIQLCHLGDPSNDAVIHNFNNKDKTKGFLSLSSTQNLPS